MNAEPDRDLGRRPAGVALGELRDSDRGVTLRSALLMRRVDGRHERFLHYGRYVITLPVFALGVLNLLILIGAFGTPPAHNWSVWLLPFGFLAFGVWWVFIERRHWRRIRAGRRQGA